jgi:alpha-tubulin suppressor-like RCC1 family protein
MAQVISANHTSHAVCADGTVMGWGGNTYKQADTTSYNDCMYALPMPGLQDIVSVSAGAYHSMALDQQGQVFAWGNNYYGCLGDGTSSDNEIVQPVPGMDNVSMISAGSAYSLFLKENGTVWACGKNTVGTLGDGTTAQRLSPVQVSGLSGIVHIDAGYSSSFAIDASGNLYGWGENTYGQMGIGSTTNVLTPQFIMSDVKKVAAGGTHTLVLKNDGSLWSFGSNDLGELGIGYYGGYSSSPVQIFSLDSIADIGAGGSFSLALRTNGDIWGWGTHIYSQIALGPVSATDICWCKVVPTQVIISDVVTLSVGWASSVVIKSDGTVMSFGANTNGQLGDGSAEPRYLPVIVTELCPVVTGISEEEEISLNVYPNPFTDEITIEGCSAESEIKIHDVLGRSIGFDVQGRDEKRIKISIAGSGAGIYFLQVRENGKLFSSKLIRH